jgi:transposase
MKATSVEKRLMWPFLGLAKDGVSMIWRKSQPDLDPWLDRARANLVASFANGVIKDKAAVGAAIDLPWPNGQTEKFVKR